jgi:hypothetical protein
VQIVLDDADLVISAHRLIRMRRGPAAQALTALSVRRLDERWRLPRSIAAPTPNPNGVMRTNGMTAPKTKMVTNTLQPIIVLVMMSRSLVEEKVVD